MGALRPNEVDPFYLELPEAAVPLPPDITEDTAGLARSSTGSLEELRGAQA